MLENQIFIILAFFKRNEIFDIVHWSVSPSQMSVMTKQKMMNILITGLHSSRMRNVRSGSRLGGGGVSARGRGVPGPLRGVPGPVGCLLVEGGCLLPGGAWYRGVSAPRRWYPSMH